MAETILTPMGWKIAKCPARGCWYIRNERHDVVHVPSLREAQALAQAAAELVQVMLEAVEARP